MQFAPYVRFVCISLLTVIMVAPAAYAKDKPQERLRQALTEVLNQQEDIYESGEGVQLKREGKITIEPVQDYYVVTMPHLELHHDDEKRVDFGVLSINARPAEKDKIWYFSMALPTPILVYNSKDLLTARLDIGKQKFSGTWHAGYHSFRDIKAHYSDVALKHHQTGFALKMPEIHIDQQMEASGTPPEWSGKANFTVKNSTLLTGKGDKLVQLGTAGIDIDLESYSPKRQQEFSNEWISLTRDSQNSARNKNITLKFYDLITKKLLQIQNSMAVTAYAEDVRIKPPKAVRQNSGKIDTKTVTFGRLQYSFGFSDVRRDKAGLNAGFEMHGFEADSKPDIAKGLIPKDMRLHYALNNLPLKDLVAFGRKQLGGGQNTNNAAMEAMQVMPKMLGEAGTTFSMKDNYIHADDYKANIDATLKADASAAMNFTLESKANIQGLKGLIGKLKTRAKETDNPMIAGYTKKAVGILTTLQMLGQQGEKGKGSRVYNVTVDKAGKAMLNGSNLSNLIQAFTGNRGESSGKATPPGGMERQKPQPQ